MSAIPVPPEVYFSDFEFDCKPYKVLRKKQFITTLKGLDNEENDQCYIHFQVNSDVKSGDYLECFNQTFLVTSIEYDTYNGEPALLKAYVRTTF